MGIENEEGQSTFALDEQVVHLVLVDVLALPWQFPNGGGHLRRSQRCPSTVPGDDLIKRECEFGARPTSFVPKMTREIEGLEKESPNPQSQRHRYHIIKNITNYNYWERGMGVRKASARNRGKSTRTSKGRAGATAKDAAGHTAHLHLKELQFAIFYTRFFE